MAKIGSAAVRGLRRFMEAQAAGGIVLLFAALLALAWANSPWHQTYTDLWEDPVWLVFGSFELKKTIGLIINDGLMVIFFFVVGMEIKREVAVGELRSLKAALFPAAGALGGMIGPALIYLTLIQSGEAARGWGIPMATDIAFAIGFLSLLGSRVPHSLKVFLVTLAIVDDLGAILVIAAFYTETIHILPLAFAFFGLACMFGIQKVGVRSVWAYVILGILIWLGFLKSGVHATIAGVLIGIMTPALPLYSMDNFWQRLKKFVQTNRREGPAIDPHELIHLGREYHSPLDRLEKGLHPWMAFAVVPLFALANAGVPFKIESLTSNTSIAVAVGLVFGKPIGITLLAWIAVKLKIAHLPRGLNWRMIFGAGLLAGIGFTMSLFIGGLALQGETLVEAKTGILLGSSCAALLGLGFLAVILKPQVVLKKF